MVNIQNITFCYPGQTRPVFSDFSLQLTESRIYGLLGKNGTGKSTLLYLIGGLLRAQRGLISCDNMVAHRRLPEMLSHIFLVPEEFTFPSLTLRAYIARLSPFYPRFSSEVLARCLADFDLSPGLHLQALSMGQQKKVLVSIALAAQTPLLLMDEPTNGLDIPSKVQFRRVVAQHMTDDRMLVISTHQVHDIEQLLDHLLILSADGLLLNASVEDITARYSFMLKPAAPLSAPSSAPASASVVDGISVDNTILYAEPALQGNAVITRRRADDPETPLNLELLFNAVTKGVLE